MDEIHPFQAMVDGMGAAWQRERAASQMTLGELIAVLRVQPPEREITGLSHPHSYRGYYRDLAFEPTDGTVTVRELLEVCERGCMGRTFEGYKGGDFVMGEQTPVWIARWGIASRQRLMGLDIDAEPIAPVTEEEDPRSGPA